MTDKLKHLDTFIQSAFTTGETASYKEYLKLAMKEYVEKIRTPSKKDAFTNQLNEFIDGSPIQLRGDDVLVNGKPVAKLINDLDDMENDMVLVFPNGKKVPVRDAKAAYQFIRDRFLKAGQD